MEEVTLEDALLWLSLPRTLGVHPESGEPIIAASGRFGPYIQCGAEKKETRSLGEGDDVYTITLERALQLLAEPKSAGFRWRASSRVLQELGEHPDSGRPVRVLDGALRALRHGRRNERQPAAVAGRDHGHAGASADADRGTGRRAQRGAPGRQAQRE